MFDEIVRFFGCIIEMFAEIVRFFGYIIMTLVIAVILICSVWSFGERLCDVSESRGWEIEGCPPQ